MADKCVRLSPVFNLEKEIDGYIPLNVSIGAKGELCVLLAEDVPDYIDGQFVPTITEETRTYRGIIIRDGNKHAFDFPGEKWNYHFFEPIDDGENLLLCSARSYNHGDGNIEKNARVFGHDGNLVREFCLGDGIGKLSVTEDNHIWCGYFDEGIFGNYGWDIPLGSAGLVKWDAEGRKVWGHQEGEGLFLFDCSDFTVDRDRVAISYHTGEDIGITENEVTSHYSTEVMTSLMLLDDERISFIRDNCLIHTERRGRSYVRRGVTALLKQDGSTLSPHRPATRGSKLLMLDGPDLYLYDMGGA
ncbi:hypothetical protein [Bhargavaea ginsengi]|uniref:hypothetical protein n=1 Tax=Bhargavaea ginsengi TaxID=426757 RepID=UPI00203D04F0|nr:hypothetical protein [Bhargavaea ginsengi]MCM3086695.1 hypothetical protein [Bhargavaea ginsengi]